MDLLVGKGLDGRAACVKDPRPWSG